MSARTPSSTAQRVTSLRAPAPRASRTASRTRAESAGRYSLAIGSTCTVSRLTSGVTRSSAYPTRIVGRPASSSRPGGALRPRTTKMDTNALGAYASVIGNFSVVEPDESVIRRCSMIPSRSTVIHASASVNGEANSTVAVSPTE